MNVHCSQKNDFECNERGRFIFIKINEKVEEPNLYVKLLIGNFIISSAYTYAQVS